MALRYKDFGKETGLLFFQKENLLTGSFIDLFSLRSWFLSKSVYLRLPGSFPHLFTYYYLHPQSNCVSTFNCASPENKNNNRESTPN